MPVTSHPWCLPKPVAHQKVRSEFKLSKEPQMASPLFEPKNSHIFLYSCCLKGGQGYLSVYLDMCVCVCVKV